MQKNESFSVNRQLYIVTKTNRIAGLFKGVNSDFAIVGAKFNQEKTKHIITYFLNTCDLDETINLLLIANEIVRSLFKDGITKAIFDDKNLFNKITPKARSEEQYIQVCEPLGAANVAGTSYAAPWIARKLSYLIDALGLNREIAKAMIIDSARAWNETPTPEEVALYGHGVVPIKIEDIVQSKDDEIKFVVTDISETYNYHFPIPYTSVQLYPQKMQKNLFRTPQTDLRSAIRGRRFFLF